MQISLVQHSKLPLVEGVYGPKKEAGSLRVVSGNRFSIGLGEKAGFGQESARTAAAQACQRMAALKYEAFALTLFGAEYAEAVAEGALLGAYSFEKYLSEKGPSLKKVEVVGPAAALKAFNRGIILAESVNLAKDLINEPSNNKAPAALAERIAKIAKKHGIQVKVLDKKQIAAEGMNSLLSVAAGSAQEPRLVVLSYGKGRPLALVGKGVTFDSGGINLKPTGHIETMKYDMAGAAAALGAMVAASRLGLRQPIVAILPLVENMPSGSASRPGDIVRASNGKTIEIINTDAEGRLILADALAFAGRMNPTATIDLATLTGAVIGALGHSFVGLFSNSDALAQKIVEAGEASGELAHRLPLIDEWRSLVKSDIADVRNTGKQAGVAGSAMGAAFLENFVVGDWAHLDIAGTGWRDEPYSYYGKGPTGSGVRLLARLIERF